MTGCAASAIATHTPNPTGAPGSAPCQPAPVPRANAITTTPPSASSLAAVTTFCTHRPDATPTRLMPVNSATNPAQRGAQHPHHEGEPGAAESRGHDAGRAEDPGADRHSHNHGQPVGQAQRALEVGHTAGECAPKKAGALRARAPAAILWML